MGQADSSGFFKTGGAFSTINCPGAWYTQATGISASGQIVGICPDGRPGTPTRGFLYSGGAFSKITVPGGVDATEANGISANGEYIVGVYETGGPSIELYHGFVDQIGTFALFDIPSSITGTTRAIGVNNAGQVVGFYSDRSGQHGFVYKGGVSSAIDFPGATSTVAVGINSNGQISGYYNDMSSQHGFVYKGGIYTSIDVPGATQTAAEGINDGGDVVGYYVDAAGNTHGFMFGGVTGYVNPKYVVMGVTYAPPGPSSGTFVQYQSSNQVGNMQSLSQSFQQQNMYSVSLSYSFGIPEFADAKVTTKYSATTTQMTTDISTVTTQFQVQQGEKTFGTGDYFHPVNHDYDVIWIWLNPLAIFTVYDNGAVVWNGYGFDGTDQPEMDIVGIQLGYLNGHFGPMPPQFQTSINRTWASGQIWPAGDGPALTSSDLAQIASFDPFSVGSYGPNYIGAVPPSQATSDHRFSLSSCSGSASFPYNQAAPSTAASVYSCMLTYTNISTQEHDFQTSFSETFSVDVSLTGTAFFQKFSADLMYSHTLTWTTISKTSLTKQTTSTSTLSVQGPPCNNATAGQGPCVPVYDSAGDQPVQFDVYQDNLYGTFMFAPVRYYTNGASPAPIVTSVSPISVTAEGPAFTLVVNGTGFVSSSTVQWNGAPLPTTFTSATQLSASVAAGLISTAGAANVTVQNPGTVASNALTFTINKLAAPSALTIVTASPLPSGTVGFSYSQGLTATGGVTPYNGWSVAGGSTLPPGLSLTQGVLPGTGLLSGTPTSSGSYTFTLQVTDAANTVATAHFSLTINSPTATITVGGISNAASYVSGNVSPGELIVIFGSFPGPTKLVGLQLDNRGYVSTNLGGMEVLFDGIQAPLIYAMAGQVSCVVPYELAGKTSTVVQVSYQGEVSNSITEPVASVEPGVFTMNFSGSGEGAIVNQDGTVNSPANPAPLGSIVSVYATGEGQTNPAGVDGKPDATPPPQPVSQPVTVMVGGVAANVTYAGGVSGLVAGVLQVNVLIPQGAPTGSAVPILLSIGGATSQASVTIALR